jgi:hypothetical protein
MHESGREFGVEREERQLEAVVDEPKEGTLRCG